MKSIKNKISRLRKKILKYQYFYHTLDQPIISDAEYDYLLNQLYNLELKNQKFITIDSPTQKIGSNLLDRFKKIQHFHPMLSLENTFDLNGYLSFHKKIKQSIGVNECISFCCELKIDGIAISLIYEEGIFVRASTRGDGRQGENITSNAKMIKSIPLQLNGTDIPERLEVRGEVFMLKSDFAKLNLEPQINKNKIFSNPRNAAGGSLRHINSQITAQRKLMFLCYSCHFFSDDREKKLATHYERLMKCLEWGLPVNKESKIFFNYNQIWDFYKKFEKKRHVLDFDIDGIVIKVNSISIQNTLGCSTKSPRWAIALKFRSDERITKLNDVQFQVGRTGAITPVAYFDPISISGVTIRKASLYNKSEIKRLNLHINDIIVVCRSGDVIPKLLNVVKTISNKNKTKIVFPEFCPVCKTKLLENKEDKVIRCHSGLTCSVQKEKRLYHFFSKKSLYVSGLGLNIIKELIKKNYVKDPIDFFYLTVIDLMKLDNLGYKKSVQIISSIKKCKKTTFKCFIYALGIPGVGETISEKIANYFIKLDKLMYADILQLNNINGIGSVIANNIFNYFSTISNCNMILKLINIVGVFWQDQEVDLQKITTSYFFSKKIVITGIFISFSRFELKNILINLGAKILNNISKETDFLIYGKKCGNKFLKAKELKIKSINEEELNNLINLQ